MRSIPYMMVAAVLLHAGCRKSGTTDLPGVSAYAPMRLGAYITYRLDSTVVLADGVSRATRSMVVRDIVDAELRDNTGRPCYRIRRMVRSAADTLLWADNAAFIATPYPDGLEQTDGNLRYIKLKAPLREGFSWKGNRLINTLTAPELQFLDDWDFTYASVGRPTTVGGITFAEALRVLQREETIGNPADRTRYSRVCRAAEVYAKGIGLVYREFLHESWQPPNAASATGYFEPNSHGIKLTYLNHKP